VITAKQILEKYVDSFKTQWGDYCEVFVNPSASELRPFDGVRFSAFYPTKEIYVWTADAVHGEVRREGITPDYFPKKTKSNRLDGSAERFRSMFVMTYESGKIRYDLTQDEARKFWTDICAKDWSWTEKYYVNIEDFLRKVRKNWLDY
jgi:hypothetical protein